jgi:hypothetical protein
VRTPILLRLLWRPFTLWNVVVTGGLAVVVGLLVLVLRAGPVEGSRAVENVVAAARVQLSVDVVLVPMALGLVVGWALFEWLLAPQAARLPRVRRRLFRELLGAALLVAILTALIADAHPGAQSPPPFLAAGFLWFAFGVVWSDPLFQAGGALRWGLLALLLGLVGGAPETMFLLQAHPGSGGAIAVILGASLLALPFHPAAMRVRATHPDCQASTAYGQGGSEAALARARTRMRWNPGRTLNGAGDWTRAALYEGLGPTGRTWFGAIVRAALVWSTCLIVGELIAGAFKVQDRNELLERLTAHLLGASGKGIPATVYMVPMFSAVVLAASRLVPEGAGAPPLSRAQRAEVAFRTSLALSVGFLLAFAVVIGIAAGVVSRLGPTATPVEGLPRYLRPCLAALALAPLPFAVGLRFAPGRRLDASANLRAAFVCGIAGLPAILLALLWDGLGTRVPGFVQLALVGVLFLVGQVLWRRELQRHFRTRDLVLR